MMAFVSIDRVAASVDWYSFSLWNIASFTGGTYLCTKAGTDIATMGAILSMCIAVGMKLLPAARACIGVFLLIGKLLRVLMPPCQPARIRAKSSSSAGVRVVQR